MRKAANEFVGSDKHSMQRFFFHKMWRNKLRRWVLLQKRWWGNTSTDFFTLQTKTQRKFVDTYGQYLYHLDTTFNTTKYNLRLCLPSVVCFLGKTTLVGCGIAPSEEGKDIDLLLNKLGLKYKEAVVATDRAKG
mgnify:CR=1 FL=1